MSKRTIAEIVGTVVLTALAYVVVRRTEMKSYNKGYKDGVEHEREDIRREVKQTFLHEDNGFQKMTKEELKDKMSKIVGA